VCITLLPASMVRVLLCALQLHGCSCSSAVTAGVPAIIESATVMFNCTDVAAADHSCSATPVPADCTCRGEQH
jgi:hypothetical protein